MGLDIIAADFPKEAKEPTDVPHGWVPPVIGSQEALMDRIKAAIPIVQFASSRSGLIVGDDFALEIGLGEKVECSYMHFTARGNEKAVGAALDILRLLNIRGIECATTGFLDADPQMPEAIRRWREFLNRAVRPGPEAPT